ncbi:MAG: TIGR03936 family radical SAM-associated protein [Planctomycetes bacterium]|nr:TIGR03936 family radical SAM-associated protein [Planctomycetota bacterium]
MIADSTAAIRFRIAGAMRFLSHAETARVWQRACARANLPVRYSEGFNPHPRMSLPLPRPVGVEAEEELLVARLCEADAAVESRAEREATVKRALAEQLPEGMEVWAVDLVAAGTSYHPRSAEYILPLRIAERAGLAERLQDGIVRIMESEHRMVERASGEGKPARPVDVRPFLLSVRLEGGALTVQHRTGEGGSIRVEEILRLFGLTAADLAGPVRRTNVIWETTERKDSSKEPCMETRAEDLEDGT